MLFLTPSFFSKIGACAKDRNSQIQNVWVIRIVLKETILVTVAAVSCSPDSYLLGGIGLGFWVMGKPGRAWVGAWVGAWDSAFPE